MPDKILISLEVLPNRRKYPLRIDANDEELIRKAAMQLRQKYVQYQQTFPDAGLEEVDMMAMVAIDIATSHLQLENKNNTVSITTKIQQLDSEIKSYLKEQ